MKVKLVHRFEEIIKVENLLRAWQGFIIGKRKRVDVQTYGAQLMDNLYALHDDLSQQTYCHGSYQAFKVTDPKPRQIHKATVRDRVVHHLLYQAIYGYFDCRFIYDSYSCRLDKGAHRAMDRFNLFAGTVSHNHTRTCYVLKGDIRKFFASIDLRLLVGIMRPSIEDESLLWLIGQVLASFNSGKPGVGLPLGNLTSQLFSNIYLNELDKYIKQELQIKYYIRYADDFVILSDNRNELEDIVPLLQDFLEIHLKLELHPQKVFIKTYNSGVDLLGWVHFPHYRQIRTVTKRRIDKRLSIPAKSAIVNSYRGLLSHGDSYRLRQRLNLI
ncbi:MAG: reverse transcriptase/maturase family protein [Candidatus Falkowbacteria bacterium]